MPSRKKIDLQAVLACMNVKCPKCGKEITPAETRRIDFKLMICPQCGEKFDAKKKV